ncbi:cytochrome c [Nitratireductor aquimarinus]|uniref:c-type cytochrome n=1 Tax=Alphaproteobacteria TaxID=28211 RepID=UPI0019D32966|nr:cytochrome c [Tritonibacter mobilis]MBN7756660.1 cytochrome c [Nitratireductor aquimarinus]
MVNVTLPDTFSGAALMGQRAFNSTCAACHGANAAGSDAGPPLVHRIHEPSHHGDEAFELAVKNGVRAHHWKFGNTPLQPEFTDADLSAVIAYVRELQRANGIDWIELTHDLSGPEPAAMRQSVQLIRVRAAKCLSSGIRQGPGAEVT